jgi:small subunit ribosomal protein S1
MDPAAGVANGPAGGKPVAGSDGLLIEVDGQIVPNYDATIRSFDEGDVVTGSVVRIDKDEVLVDIGYKSEGVIPSGELSIRRSVDPAEEVSLGDEVDALVLTKEDQEGRLILSKKRARFERAWRKIEGAAESGEAVPGTVIEVVKGGLILDLGVRGFLPASLVDIRRVHNLDELMGQQLECRVIELNRSRNNVVLSRRAVLEEERKEVREQILGRLQPGQVVEGRISNIVDFGAFVDLEGIDGLIHISELSWSHVNHPSEVVSIGASVRVKVLDIDRERQRISLGLKQTQEDPWQRVLDSYQPGESLEGKVTKVVAFGAFVQIVPGVEGLVHISELAEHHVDNPSEVVHPGDEVRVKILEIEEERRRMSLSIKRVGEGGLPLRDAFADAQASVSPGAEPGSAPEPESESAPELEPPSAPEAESAPAAEPEPGPEGELASAPTPDPPSAPESDPASAPAPESAPEPGSPREAELEPAADSDPASAAAPDPASAPAPESAPEPQSPPESAPAPESAPEPAPEPEPGSEDVPELGLSEEVFAEPPAGDLGAADDAGTEAPPG